MSNSPADTITGHFQDSVDTAATALKAAASGTHEFTEEASAVLATTSTELTKLAESLRAHAVGGAKDAARYVKHEVEAHPLASLAAALTAVVAMMGMMAVNRRS
jgi:hypothetical protein